VPSHFKRSLIIVEVVVVVVVVIVVVVEKPTNSRPVDPLATPDTPALPHELSLVLYFVVVV
jgi:hypothetical protein